MVKKRPAAKIDARQGPRLPAELPERAAEDPTLAASLSPNGLERLQWFGFRREAAHTARLEVLHEILRRERLPRYPEVDRLEQRFGGLLKTYRHSASWIFFGAYGMLADPAQSADHADAAAGCDALESGDDWPRVRFEGEALVPVGGHVDATYYAAPGGSLLAHDWVTDTVEKAADEAPVLVERVLLRLMFAERARGAIGGALDVPAHAAVALAAALNLREAAFATDALERWWEDAPGHTLLVQTSKGDARLATNDPSVLASARSFQAQRSCT
jgi:hypothetical protein